MKTKPLKLTELARKTIEAFFTRKKFPVNEETKKRYSKKQASFVTLTEKSNNNLRGCIGSLIPRQELWKDVQENALNAAFEDMRFPPIKREELNKIKIEVSVLSIPKPLKYKDEKDLLSKLNESMGIILKKGYSSATFLPQVWEQLPDKIDFLEHLAQKAGLSKNEWKTAEYEFYTVKKEEE